MPPAKPGAPAWPFDLSRSRLLEPFGADPGALRLLGAALVVVTLATFSLAGVAGIGLLSPSLWAPFAAAGACASLALLTVYFHRWLIVGISIDALLLWGVLIAGWTAVDGRT
jgi:hypothetical protein